MTAERLQEFLKNGENTEVEFKTSQFELNKDVFESVCAFLNRKGGHLFLGIRNDGVVEGIMDSCVETIADNLVNNANNPQKLNPPYYLSTELMELEGKKIIYVVVPESSQVHSTNGRIFDRNRDGDFDITRQTEQVTQLYLRKQTTYSENRICPFIQLDDFRTDLFEKVRRLAKNERANHPWLNMTNEDLLRSAGLFRKDHFKGNSGFTLAAVLLFGKDDVIQSVLPHFRIDALLRVENADRYDDRDDIRTNLLDAYTRLTDFVKKHLPDKFFQEGSQRISLRDRIFREVIGNLIIHREYVNPFPAKLIIEKDRVILENWNRPHNNGIIDPLNFSPYPKNPLIAKFFKEIGIVDELGSGVRNAFKYCGIYSAGAIPEFVEDDVFRTVIPLKMTTQMTTQMILDLLSKDPTLSRSKLAQFINNITEDGIKYHLEKLKEEGKIRRSGGTRGKWEIIN